VILSVGISIFYGLAFLILGAVTLLQTRTPVNIIPRQAMLLLGLFAVIHGGHEWAQIILMFQGGIGSAGTNQATLIGLALLVLSFIFLAAFGVYLLVLGPKRLMWSMAIPCGFLALWITATFFIRDTDISSWQALTFALARYLIGLPASMLAALGLYSIAKRMTGPWKRVKKHLFASAIFFFIYGIFSGLIVHPVPFFPGSWLNAAMILNLTGLPVILFRAICAFAISILLAEAFLVQITKIHQEMEQLRKEFISIIAHDLRTPLTSILSSAELLDKLSRMGQLDSVRQETLIGHIKSSATQQKQLISDLLDSSLIEVNQVVLKKTRVELYSFINQLATRTSEITKEHLLKVKVVNSSLYEAGDGSGADGGGITDAWVLADPNRLEQILSNLLSNAGKYSTPASPITISVKTLPKECIVAVTNLGPGILPEEIPLLFTRFHRSRETLKGKIGGLGLGLYIVRGLVEAHNGRVWVESKIGQTTTFFFSLPRDVLPQKNYETKSEVA
jgi:signal transduction histidine kinase